PPPGLWAPAADMVEGADAVELDHAEAEDQHRQQPWGIRAAAPAERDAQGERAECREGVEAPAQQRLAGRVLLRARGGRRGRGGRRAAVVLHGRRANLDYGWSAPRRPDAREPADSTLTRAGSQRFRTATRQAASRWRTAGGRLTAASAAGA